MKEKVIWNCAKRFKLTLEEIWSLNRLLNVQYVNLIQYQYKYAEEFSALSRIFTGRIELSLFSDVDAAKNHSNIIKQIHKQLYALRCDAKSLIASSDMPQLDLAFIGMDVKNLYEFKQVLAKHQIKKVAVGNSEIMASSFDVNIDDNFFDDFPTCSSVEELNFNWKELNEDQDIVSKVTKMVSFFPNLKELLYRSIAVHYTAEQVDYLFKRKHKVPTFQFSLQKLVVWVSNECKKLEELHKTKLSTTLMVIYYVFTIRKPESSKVVKKLVRKILRTTKFLLYSVKLVTPNSDDKDTLIKQHYALELRRFMNADSGAILQFTIDLDPLIVNNEDLDEVVSSADEDD
ncbi:hypothetical protein M3Y94_00772200 [Aphelenchoides besseyi]|nr:hypothetical protein M3Y94_00772200 [Aphelenchoides besseyi]